MKFKKGLSLLEMVVVVAIVGLLTSISYVYYGGYVRQGRQLEAKTHLGQVRQLQISYFTEKQELSPSMKTLGFKPLAQIRYNIGTRWQPNIDDSLVKNDPAQSICPCGDTSSECFAHPNPETNKNNFSNCGTSQLKCFGPVEKGDMREQIKDSIWRRPSETTRQQSDSLFALLWDEAQLLDGSGGIDSTRGKRDFVYIAIGCTASTKTYMKESNLDIWAISRRGILKNIQNGVTRDDTD